ncbi:MAG: NAD(P)H-dependent oxidoreductase [Bacilli bacterium]
MKETREEIIAAFNHREATKEFRIDKKISDEDFNFILETGRLSPSSFGWEPWQFLVVQNMDLRMKLKEVSWGAQKQLPSASHFVIILGRRADQLKTESKYLHHISEEINHLTPEIEKMKANAFDSFMKNDFKMDTDKKIFDWVGKQTYLAFANMMTSAALIGIDSCPMEGFNMAAVEEILKETGEVDMDEYGPVAMVAFGYRTENLPYNKTRRPVDEVVKWIN